MVDGGESLELHEEVHFVDAIVAKGCNFLPCVDLVLDFDSITGRVSCNTRSFRCSFHWNDLPSAVVDMSARLKLVYEEIELFAVELFVQCLGLSTEKIQLPQAILGQGKVIISERSICSLEDLLWNADLVEDEEDAWTLFEDPIEVGIVGQAIPKRQYAMEGVHMPL